MLQRPISVRIPRGRGQTVSSANPNRARSMTTSTRSTKRPSAAAKAGRRRGASASSPSRRRQGRRGFRRLGGAWPTTSADEQPVRPGARRRHQGQPGVKRFPRKMPTPASPRGASSCRPVAGRGFDISASCWRRRLEPASRRPRTSAPSPARSRTTPVRRAGAHREVHEGHRLGVHLVVDEGPFHKDRTFSMRYSPLGRRRGSTWTGSG